MSEQVQGLQQVVARPVAQGRTTTLGAILRSWKAVFGLLVVALVVTCALLSPQLSPFDPNLQSLAGRLKPPFSVIGNNHHLLGTDQLGRDILSRLIYGTRVSLLVGVSAAFIAGVIGVLLGLLAGFVGGWLDVLIMRLCDVQLALPYILIAIAVLAITGSNLLNIILILSLTQWVTYARMVRGATLVEREKDYVQAARALGFGSIKIMLRYILPNVFAPVIVIATFSVAQTIIAESALSFLGLGLSASIPSWGGMLADGRTYLAIAWWLATIPGLVITLTVIGINLLGDWLRDHLDPRLRL